MDIARWDARIHDNIGPWLGFDFRLKCRICGHWQGESTQGCAISRPADGKDFEEWVQQTALIATDSLMRRRDCDNCGATSAVPNLGRERFAIEAGNRLTSAWFVANGAARELNLVPGSAG